MPLFLFDDDPDLRKGFCWSSAMLERGVYVHPWHNMFLCAAHTPAATAAANVLSVMSSSKCRRRPEAPSRCCGDPRLIP